jgi:hypothetical protein
MSAPDCATVRHSPKVPRQLSKYGLKGAVELSAATAIRIYQAVVAFAMVGFAIAGVSAVAIGLCVLMLLITALAIGRARPAARTGKAWRQARTAT